MLLMGVAGLLAGGTYSMAKQKRVPAAVVCAILAVLALAGAILWLGPQGGDA